MRGRWVGLPLRFVVKAAEDVGDHVDLTGNVLQSEVVFLQGEEPTNDFGRSSLVHEE